MNIKVKHQLFGSFILICVLFILLGLISLRNIGLLNENVKLTKDHPLAVTQATIKIEVLITAMHRSMKDVVLSKDEIQRSFYVDKVKRDEICALENFEIVRKQILGREGEVMAEQALTNFNDWQPIRNRVIDYMEEGEKERAQTITRTIGDEYVKDLLDDLKLIEEYAAAKAMSFSTSSTILARKASFLILICLIAGILISVVISSIIWYSINKRILNLNRAAEEFAKGNLEYQIDTPRKDKLGELAMQFSLMRDQLKASYRSLEDKVLSLSENENKMKQIISELEESTRKLGIEQKNLKMANSELESFAYSVSHDLRAPLRAINGFSGFLVQDYGDRLDAEGIRMLNVVKDNVVKMDALISDILRLSRISSYELEFADINMKELASQCYQDLSPNGNPEEFDFFVDNMPNCKGDIAMIKQVWSNLLENSIKYSLKSKTRKIEVGCIDKSSELAYFVKDYGAGFNMEYHDKLFGVFQRLHNSSEYPGTGVGLAIVERIVTKHNGKVWAQGELDVGSTFYFSIPKII